MKKEVLTEGVVLFTTEQKGPTVAILGGVHGNEKTGIRVLEYLEKNLTIDKGSLYLIYGNPKAIKENVRFVEENLNRLFLPDISHTTYEGMRAQELVPILAKCDGVLDIHTYNDDNPEGLPFVICEDINYEIVKKMNIPMVISGFATHCPGGTDGFMHSQEKIGICIELGPTLSSKDHTPLGIESAMIFLAHYGLVDFTPSPRKIEQQVLGLHTIHTKKSDTFAFTKKYSSFDPITKGEAIVHEGKETIHASVDGYILFPRERAPLGAEVFMELVARKN